MDEYLNCLLSICCPPERRVEVLAKWLVTQGVDAHAAESCARCMDQTFDLAPKGTLQPLIQVVARLARGQTFTG